MEFALTPSGLVYNLPALLVLTYILARRPAEGLVLVLFVVMRMTGEWPFSMHATIATFAVLGYRLHHVGRLAGLALLALTAYYYHWVFDAVPMFEIGVQYGLLMVVIHYLFVGGGALLMRKRPGRGGQKKGAGA